MPLPSEHSCRIRQPDEFQPESFRRMVQGKLAMIIGKLKGESATTVQAFRYPTDQWSEKEARAHCAAQGGRFEGAMTNAIRQAAGRSRD
jgi:hypothetical protein